MGWIDGSDAEMSQAALPLAEIPSPIAPSPVRPRSRQARLGQYLTPTSVSTFMVRMFPDLPHRIRLLDPGAAGAL